MTISRMHLRLPRITTAVADGLTMANPPGWPNPPLLRFNRTSPDGTHTRDAAIAIA